MMKFNKTMTVAAILSGLVLVGCGQSGPLYLKAQAPQHTTKANIPPHPNDTTTHPTRPTPGVSSTNTVSQAPTVISEQPVA
jgi:predicted small lipoprotein YifL